MRDKVVGTYNRVLSLAGKEVTAAAGTRKQSQYIH
jgi:hypothetical protein